MKMLIAVALGATSLPVFTTSTAVAGERDTASSDRRLCRQVSVRAGSRMSGRRICRTATEWREALGPDWRMHLAGSTGTQDDYDALQARTTPGGDTGGQSGVPFSASRQRGPR